MASKLTCDTCRGDAISIRCEELGFEQLRGDPGIRIVCVECQRMVGNCSCVTDIPQDYWEDRLLLLSDYFVALCQGLPDGPLGSTQSLLKEYESQVKKYKEKWSERANRRIR